ncbi:MAG TPA: hypothetical protein PLN52_24425, partial [Opitutaceae bacterium]|nr:hypothetical protein [Opitutaceae bacterium]
PGTFDGGAILGLTSTAVHAGDETWMLYTAINTGHGGALPPKRLTIGRATWRLHGFASLDAGPEQGRLLTRPILVRGGVIEINADAHQGILRAALLDAKGQPLPDFRLEDCEPLQRDATRHRLRWKAGRTIPEDRAVQVLIEMTRARLFSLTGGTSR